MSTTPFPSTLADLHFPQSSPDHPTHSIYSTLRQLRRSTLSIPNRLDSILADSLFAQAVSTSYALPLVANERCGAWYIPPGLKAGSAYFKSTDGHHGQWDFSLRRLNLDVLRVLGQAGGAVLVDSTRRGKRVPDSLAKTVPVWVAVVNRVCFPELGAEWHGVQCERGREGLGGSEVSQIESRIGSFVERFRELGVDVNGLRGWLKRPIRVNYAVNGVENERIAEPGWDMLEDVDVDAFPTTEKREYNLLVLCSVSRRVHGAEISEGGYIQGAGDDSEGWSHGLTPELFWANKDLLLTSPEEELPDIISELVEAKKKAGGDITPILIGNTAGLYIAASSAEASAPEKDASHKVGKNHTTSCEYDLTINCNLKDSSGSSRILDLGCRTGKLGSRDLRDKLPAVKSFVSTMYERSPGARILVTCATGTDLSVGVAVMLLCLFYDQTGAVDTPTAARSMDKTLVKQRLAWISSSKPDVNPSRSTLQSVNAFLMERP